MKHWTEFKPRNDVKNVYKMFGRGKWKKKIWYKALPITFDTESTSFRNADGQKRACLYIWQADVYGDVYFGRKTEEIPLFLDMIRDAYNLNEDHKTIVYVHNLAWDAQFILPHLFITRMFATDERKPLTFESDNCFEWRCSLRLSGKKLATLAEDWKDELPELQKQSGYDYNAMRHYKTKLTDLEMKYAEYDVLVLYKYILTQIEEFDTICNIPLTNTGRARRYAFNHCQKDKAFMSLFKKCTPRDPELYRMLNEAYMGGVTHANRYYAGIPLENVVSKDLSSSYPSQMVKRKYPLTPFKRTEINDIDKYLEAFPDRAIVMTARLTNFEATTLHSVWSASKCISINNFKADNGRVIRADEIVVRMTEVDYANLRMFYKFDIEVLDAYTAYKKYLPSCFVDVVLDLYEKKTALKGIKEKEREYKLGKALLNSLYGMCVTALLHDSIDYTFDVAGCDDMWTITKLDRNNDEVVQEALDAFAEDPKSFLLYQTGVWISAYARNDLLTMIKAIVDKAQNVNEDGLPIDDVVYYDTDSIKMLHGERYQDIFDEFNAKNCKMHEDAMKHHGWDNRYAIPDIKGRVHTLGVYEDDGCYSDFKTLGAKRYIDIEDGEFAVTICGVNKTKCAEYMLSHCGDDTDALFEMFEDGMFIPSEYSGKTTCFYGDFEFVDSLTDLNGDMETVHELAFVHLEPTDFELNMMGDFKQLLRSTRGDVIV